MELTQLILYVNVNGIQFCFRKDDTTKKWRIDDKSVNISSKDMDKQIQTIEGVLKIVKTLDAGASETDMLNNIASNFTGDVPDAEEEVA